MTSIHIPPPNPTVVYIEAQAPGTVNTTQITTASGRVWAYHHVQSVSSSEWDIVHNLGFYPNVTVIDSVGTLIEGETTYINSNHIRLTFSETFSGNAYLS